MTRKPTDEHVLKQRGIFSAIQKANGKKCFEQIAKDLEMGNMDYSLNTYKSLIRWGERHNFIEFAPKSDNSLSGDKFPKLTPQGLSILNK